MLLFCGNYALRYPQKVMPGVLIASLYSVLLLGAFVLPTLLCGMGEIIEAPVYLIHMPQFLLQWVLFVIYNYAQVIKLHFFHAYTFQLIPSWLLLGVVLLEIILPGVILTVIERGLGWVVKWLRSPFRLGIGKLSRQEVGVLAVLLVLLFLILYQRAASGLLWAAMSMGVVALKLVGLFVLLPVLVIVFSLRMDLFRRLESSLTVISHQ